MRVATAHLGMTILTVLGPSGLTEIIDRMSVNTATPELTLDGLADLFAHGSPPSTDLDPVAILPADTPR